MIRLHGLFTLNHSKLSRQYLLWWLISKLLIHTKQTLTESQRGVSLHKYVCADQLWPLICRVINNLRHADVGIPITFQQYQKSGAEAIVDRLVNRHLHFVACRICEFLKMKPNRVLIHWACCKVQLLGCHLCWCRYVCRWNVLYNFLTR